MSNSAYSQGLGQIFIIGQVTPPYSADGHISHDRKPKGLFISDITKTLKAFNSLDKEEGAHMHWISNSQRFSTPLDAAKNYS